MGPRQTIGVFSVTKNAIDMSWMPWAVLMGLKLFWVVVGFVVGGMPKIRAWLGPWMSPSRIPTFRPLAAMAVARFAVTVDLPTPPLPDAMAMMFFMLLSMVFPFYGVLGFMVG